MTSEEIIKLSALELGKAIREGKTSSVEACHAYLSAIDEKDGEYNSYITVLREESLCRAAQVDADISAGKLTGPLAGVPIAVKDNICTKGVLTSCGSKMLSNFVPPYDATVVNKINEAGMVIIGKVNMDEFAMGSTTETSYYGPTVNPHGINRVPGGSSGGSAASVAAGLAPIALGSDTGGSIRQPSSFCGVTGLKPTYGSVSRYGLVAFASSLDQIGPIAKNAEDAAALYNIICGEDAKDQSSSKEASAVDMSELESFSLKGKKIGLPEEYFGDGIDADVREKVNAAIEVMKGLGAEVETHRVCGGLFKPLTL